MTKLELKKTLGKGHLQSVIEELIKGVNEENLNDVILLNSRFNSLEIQNSRGVIGIQDYMLERNRISVALLNTIDKNDVESEKPIESSQDVGNWKLNWIKANYPNSLIKKDNQLPIMREFVNSELDFRVILPEKFEMQDKLPYSGEVGINFINFNDGDKIEMSISLGINLVLLGGIKKFIIAIIIPPTNDNFVHEKYGQIKSLISESYNSEMVESKIDIQMLKENTKTEANKT